jgi:prevent-host-death family protein
MKTVSPTELRSNIFKLLDEVITSGVPIEINKGGKLLRIVPVEKVNKLANLSPKQDVIVGNPDDLADISGKRRSILIYLDTHIAVWLFAGQLAKLRQRQKIF